MQVCSDGALYPSFKRRIQHAQLNLQLDAPVGELHMEVSPLVFGAQLVPFPGVVNSIFSPKVFGNALYANSRLVTREAVVVLDMDTRHGRIEV